ncbi:MAG: HNH endonuclease [Verrucomicrobia bacterium]|nr:HNH endonuclease [Verrucomicrobiota bacterium]
MAVLGQLRQIVVARARNRCEYCGLAQDGQEAAFHVDHIVPATAGGQTEAENLALACVSCSLRKGARQAGHDPDTGSEARLFNPRRDAWGHHLRWEGVAIVGLTPTGRATVSMLKLNRPIMLAIREEEFSRGRYPASP